MSDVSLNFNAVSLSEECKNAYVTKVQYKNPTTEAYVDLPSNNITEGKYGSKTLRWPLIEIYNFSATSNVVGS